MPQLKPLKIIKGKYPKKVFGELSLKGGLKNNLKQVLRTKYLLPTKEFPEGKAVIELIIPDNVNSVSIGKNELKDIPEIIENLSYLIDELGSAENKQLICSQIKFNKLIFEEAKKTPFIVKSFRFTEKDYMKSQELMFHLAKLFGYLFFKYKTEIEKEGREEFLASSRNAVANGMVEKVHKNFVEGFMEGVNEDGEE